MAKDFAAPFSDRANRIAWEKTKVDPGFWCLSLLALASFLIGFWATHAQAFYLLLLVIFILLAYWRNTRIRLKVRPFNEIDWRLAQELRRLSPDGAHEVDVSASDIGAYQGLRVGELIRQFDSHTTGSITGWLDHHLVPHGYVAGVDIGRVGLGFGRIAIDGESWVELGYSGVTRDHPLGEGFVAVFDYDRKGGPADTLRLVVPSLPASRAMVHQVLRSVSSRMGEGTHTAKAVDSYVGQIDRLPNESSYVSDRLNSFLRLPIQQQPKVDAIGALLNSTCSAC